jgi:hypothetical protein
MTACEAQIYRVCVMRGKEKIGVQERIGIRFMKPGPGLSPKARRRRHARKGQKWTRVSKPPLRFFIGSASAEAIASCPRVQDSITDPISDDSADDTHALASGIGDLSD